MAVSMRIDAAELGLLDDRFRAVVARAENMTPAMDGIGSYLVSRAQLRFERERAPDGTPWQPSIRAKLTGGRTLTDSGRLRDSVTYAAGPRSVSVGTNVKYAAIHQFGGTIRPKSAKALRFAIPGLGFRTVPSVTIPARPFLGVEEGDAAEFTEILRDHLLGDLR